MVRYDRVTGAIEPMSVAADGNQAVGHSEGPVPTDNGDVVFYSWAQNLVFGDTNTGTDIFTRTFNMYFPAPYCIGKTGSNGCIPFLTTDAGSPSVSSTSAWNVRSNDMHDAEAGFGIIGFKKSNLNFHGGKLCVKTPFTRTPLAKTKQVACIDTFGGCGTSSCRQLLRNMTVTIQNDTTGLPHGRPGAAFPNAPTRPYGAAGLRRQPLEWRPVHDRSVAKRRREVPTSHGQDSTHLDRAAARGRGGPGAS